MKCLLPLVLLLSQVPANVKPAFEIVSVKKSTPGVRESMLNQTGRFAANNLTLRQLIAFAYRPANSQVPQIAGGSDWVADDQWTIEAKVADADTAVGPEIVSLRLQSLLEDRFLLKLHREMREQAVYALIVNKGGLKMPAVDAPEAGQEPPPAAPRLGPDGTLPANFMPAPGRIMAGPGVILASAVTMTQIANTLNRAVDRPIVDRTNLTGYFNMRLQYAPGAAAPAVVADTASAPSIFTAVQEQLGLRLEPSKNPMEVLVIDRVQRPTEN